MYDYSPLDGRPGLLMTFSDAKDDTERLIWDGLVRLLVSTLPGITQEIDEIIWYDACGINRPFQSMHD